MNNHPETLRHYSSSSQNRVDYMSRFLGILLARLGFRTPFESYPLEPALIENIRDCAKTCSVQIERDFRNLLDVVFMERILHHFLNCVHIDTSREEPIILEDIRYWGWLSNLIKKRK